MRVIRYNTVMRKSKLDIELIAKMQSSPEKFSVREISKRLGVTESHLSKFLSRFKKTVTYTK